MLQKTHSDLGISNSHSIETLMPVFEEPGKLVSIGADIYGRTQKHLLDHIADNMNVYGIHETHD